MDTVDTPDSTGATEQVVFLGILRVAEMFTRSLSEALRPFRLTPSQYRVLEALRLTEAEGLRCREVGKRLLSRDPDITRLLDRLEARGFISRGRGSEDRRVVRTRITTEGIELLAAVDRKVRDLHTRYLGHFAHGELSAFDALLTATVEPS